ncbi:hypothetical protein Hanom_Chr00s016000g01755481 [Helianthus anomalus]
MYVFDEFDESDDVISRGVNEPSRARARPGSTRLELGSLGFYEARARARLGSRVKPKARARLDSARTILRTNLNELKAWLEFTSTSLKHAKARLELAHHCYHHY